MRRDIAGVVLAAFAMAGLTACGNSPARQTAAGAPTASQSTTAPGPSDLPSTQTTAKADALVLTAAEVAAPLSRLGCTPTPSGPSLNLGIKPTASLDCTINGEDVTIDQYLDRKQLVVAVREAKTIGCAFIKQLGLSSFVYVEGTNWTVTPKTNSTAEQIRAAEGGSSKVATVHCQ